MANVGVDFILRARTTLFNQGLASANNAIKDLKKSVREFDIGNGFKQLLGVGGIVEAFRMAITNAQTLRDEADKLGKSIDRGTRSVAEYGDAIGKMASGFKNALTEGLSFFTQIGDSARHFFQGVTQDQEDAARKMVAETAKAADEAEKKLAASREANSPEKMAAAQEKLNKAQREGAAKGTEAQKKLINLINDRADLEDKLSKTPKNTTAAIELQTAIAQNETDTKEATKGFDEEAKQAQDKKREADKKLIENFAPTVEELAKKNVGGFFDANDPRLRARQALKQEDISRALFDRGDFKGGLAAAKKAQGLRQSLENQTSGSGALTPKAAEDAVHEALTDTNEKLDTLTKTVAGIIKAQK